MNDGNASHPRSRTDDLLRLLAYVVFLFANLAIMASGLPRIGSLAAITATLMISSVVILVHELGHACAVWWLRGKVLKIAVGPAMAQLNPFRLSVTEDDDEREVGGFVTYSFDGRETTRKDLTVVLAGPGANLILSALAVGTALLLSPATSPIAREPQVTAFSPSADAPFVVARMPTATAIERTIAEKRLREIWIPLLRALAILSVAVAIANLIPFRGSDGAEVRSIIALELEARRYRARSP